MRSTPDFATTSYWLDDTPSTAIPRSNLPKNADVVVIGSGYTGLNTALVTARGGRSTVVLEAGDVGEGCSTRNGGQISTSIKPSVDVLAQQVGLERAKAIRQEGEQALTWIETFVQKEDIDCHFERNGRFHAAHTPKHFDKLVREAAELKQKEQIEVHVVPRHEQRTELGTDAYHGGVVFPRHASLHAGKYHHGLVRAALACGVTVIPNSPATKIKPIATTGDRRFVISTPQGAVTTCHVMIATNGYTTNLTPWWQRRVIPIGSYIIATEPLSSTLIDELFPTHRIASDTCRVVYYYRASPDRTRVLFGGRVSATETDPRRSAPRLYADMCRIFPQLNGTRLSHSWAGKVAYTFDTLSHTGVHKGCHYAMGYCGSGVSMASYLGMRAGQKIIGQEEGKTALDDLPFPTRPLYRGQPWFLPSVVAWYRWRDKMEYQRANT